VHASCDSYKRRKAVINYLNPLVFIMKTKYVSCEVRTEFLNKGKVDADFN
jgi:hypothetical protein